jgi:hypothetical protein
MDEKESTHRADEWTESLSALQALSAEINAGLLALSQNDLRQFEARVEAQQRICQELRSSGLLERANLKQFAAELKKAAASIVREPSPQVSSTPAQKLVPLELAHLNRVYAAFVARTQKVFQALIALHQGVREGYSREGKAVTTDHTWSCEV